MYKKEDDSIEIIYKDGSTRDIAKLRICSTSLFSPEKVKKILYMLPAFRKTTDIK